MSLDDRLRRLERLTSTRRRLRSASFQALVELQIAMMEQLTSPGKEGSPERAEKLARIQELQEAYESTLTD